MRFMLNSGLGTCVAVIFFFTTSVIGQDVLKCMSCRKAPHFTHCENMIACDPDREVCYVEEEIDIGGEVVVNAGCRNKTNCDAIGCFGDENRRKRSSSNKTSVGTNTGQLDRDIICHHCCDGDFCNMYGCPDSFDVSHLTGSRCFVCDHVVHPEYCNVIKNCEAGYSCGTETLSFGSEKRYSLLCIRTQKCEMLKLLHTNNSGRKKRNYQQIWAECCEGHLCNGYMPMKIDSPSMISATYTCPSPGTKPNTGNSEIHGPATLLSSTTSTTISTSVTDASTTVAVCEDTDSDCNAYGEDYICVGAYKEWAEQHCAKYCGFCGSTTLRTTQAIHTCHDLDSDCAEYGHDYICTGDYVPWSKIHCTKFCGFCQIVECKDLDYDCAEYGHDYICQGDYIPWAQIHCQNYCGLCDVPTAPPVSTTMPSTTTTVKDVVTTVAPAHCNDIDSDCGEYGIDYICTGDYIPWSMIHCNKTCNFCHDVCVDVDSDCAEYGADYICHGDYIEWSKIHCAHFCNFCPATTLPPTTIKLTTTPLKTKPSTTASPTTTLPTTTSTTTRRSTTPTTITSTTTTPTTTMPITTTPTTTMPSTTTSAAPTPTTTRTTTTLTTKSTTTKPTTTTPTTTTPTTTSTTTTPTTTMSKDASCGNVLSDCDKYPLNLCTDKDQREWMWDNCRGHCKMCLQNKPCKDITSGCTDFKDVICGDPVMSLECKDTCGIC